MRFRVALVASNGTPGPGYSEVHAIFDRHAHIGSKIVEWPRAGGIRIAYHRGEASFLDSQSFLTAYMNEIDARDA